MNAQLPLSRKTGVTYEDKIVLPGHITLETVETVIDKIREYGSAEIKGRVITMSFEEDDDWDLREVLGEIETELRSWDVSFSPSKDKLRRDGLKAKNASRRAQPFDQDPE